MRARDAITWLNIDRTEGAPAIEVAPVIEVAPRPPKVRQKKGPGANVFMGSVKYAVVPLRAVWMLIDKPHLMVYLAALGAHAKPSGLAWPSQERLGALIGRHPRNAGRAMLRLEQMGLVKRVKSKSRYPRHAKRRYVMFDEDAKLPADEVEIIPDEYVRFPFNDDPRFRRTDADRKGEAPMALTFAERSQFTQAERGAAIAANRRLEDALQAAGERVDRKLGDVRAEILGFPPAVKHNVDTVKRWLKMAAPNWPRSGDDLLDAARATRLEKWVKTEMEGVIRSILAHAEVQYRQMIGRPANDSLRLQDLKPPSWVTR